MALTWRSFDTRFTLAQVPRPEDLTEAQRVSFAMGVKLKVEKKFASLDALRKKKGWKIQMIEDGMERTHHQKDLRPYVTSLPQAFYFHFLMGRDN